MNTNHNDISRMLRAMSPRDFLKIGMNEIAYVRSMKMEGIGHLVFGVYAADGTQLSLSETMDNAVELLRHNDLIAVTLH